jgi:hypothetical protein
VIHHRVAIVFAEDKINHTQAWRQAAPEVRYEGLLNRHNFPALPNILNGECYRVLQLAPICAIVAVDEFVKHVRSWDATTPKASVVPCQCLMKNSAFDKVIRLGDEPDTANKLKVIAVGAKFQGTDM